MVPVVKEIVADIRKAAGFRVAFFARSAHDRTRGASVLFFDSRQRTVAACEARLATMYKRLPSVSMRASSRFAASIRCGESLIARMPYSVQASNVM